MFINDLEENINEKTVSLLFVIIAVLGILSSCSGSDNDEKENILSQLTTGEWEHKGDSSTETYVFSNDYTYYNEKGALKYEGTFKIVKVSNNDFRIKTTNQHDVTSSLSITYENDNIKYIVDPYKTIYQKVTEEELQKREKERQEELDKIDAENKEKAKVEIIDVTCSSTFSGDHYFTTISGKLFNSGDKDYSYAKIQIILYGENGESIGQTTKTINENITPGKTIDFLRAVNTNSKAAKAIANVKVLN